MSYSDAMMDAMLQQVRTAAVTVGVLDTNAADITANFAARAAQNVAFSAPVARARGGRQISNDALITFGKASGDQSVGAYTVLDTNGDEVARVTFEVARLISDGDSMSADIGDITLGIS